MSRVLQREIDEAMYEEELLNLQNAANIRMIKNHKEYLEKRKEFEEEIHKMEEYTARSLYRFLEDMYEDQIYQ